MGARRLLFALGITFLGGALPVHAQLPEWRPIGDYVLDAGLAAPAGGPVLRVWYSSDGARLFVRTGSNRLFQTAGGEAWVETAATPPEAVPANARSRPELGARLRASSGGRGPLYAFGRAIYRSVDDGLNWENVSEARGHSLVGDQLFDLAVSPRNPEEIVAATSAGLWRSLDGGLSWGGLNEALPNLPIRRILTAPGAGAAARIALGVGEAVWRPAFRQGWAPVDAAATRSEAEMRRALTGAIGWEITAVAVAGDWVYAGGRGGRLFVSPDEGRSWRPFVLSASGDVEALYVPPADPRVALAALSGAGARIVRTVNGGIFWDDLTANLGPGAALGVTADLATGTVYAATAAGLAMTVADLSRAGAAGAWQLLPGLPRAPVVDVKLDPGGHQLYAAVEGYGLFGTMAPHRFRDPKVVNAADYSSRPAAPGSLLSVVGSKVTAARAGQFVAPVLAAVAAGSQIQVPFGVTGTSLSLALSAAGLDGAITRRDLRLALQATSPAIFVDHDGTPMALDADRGILLDAATPVQAGSRVQVLATGLGNVSPEWPTGLAAPLDNPPKVVAPVKAFLDRVPVQVTRATLAPGYVGFYLIEFQAPEIVNAGPAEFYIEAGARESARVTLYLIQ